MVHQRQIQGLIGSSVRPVIRRLPGNGPIIHDRGINASSPSTKQGFSGVSPFLFGVVLEHFLARQVSVIPSPKLRWSRCNAG
jgi:type VI secretion system protein ImpG